MIVASINRSAITAEWRRQVDQRRAGGLSASESIAAVVRDSPALHEAYLAAANTRAPQPAAGTPTGQAAIALWDRLVASQVQTGADQAAAIRAVVHNNPGLHEEYLAAVNAGRRGSRSRTA